MSSDSPVLRADAVVIGSGAGGAPAAATLAEAGLDVILLEAGPHLGSADFTGREGEMIGRLMTARIAGDSGMELYAGACVGGSTVVNDALCWPTPPEVLQAWREDFGLAGLGDAGFSALNERVWRDIHASPTGRDHLNRNAHRLEVGAARLGWAAEAMARNVRGCANLGLCNLGCPANAKQSTLLTYVPRAARAGAQLEASVRAERLDLADGRVRAVEAVRLDPDSREIVSRLRIEAPIVCVAAGVLATAALLQRSGLSGSLPRLGRDLQFHSSAYVSARFREPVHAYYGPTMAYAVTEFADVNGRDGPGFMLENTAVSAVTEAQSLPGFGADHARVMAALPHLARAVVVLRDRTRGTLESGSDGSAAIRYMPAPEDLERLRQGLHALGRAYLASGAEEVFLPLHGVEPITDERELDAALAERTLRPRDFSLLYAVHLFGGATLGATAETSSLREDGQVWGVRGLYVTDAASLPTNTGVNPQVTVMSNSLRIADGIAARAVAAS